MSGETKSVVVLTAEKPEHWECMLLRGVLAYHGLHAEVHTHENDAGIPGDALVLLHITPRTSGWLSDRPGSRNRTQVLVGHLASVAYLHGELAPGQNEILVYGEPYALVARLAHEPGLLEHYRGSAVLGPLLEPRAYRAPSRASLEPGMRPILTSLGCEKTCGYCSYGSTNITLYGSSFKRRSRSSQQVSQDLIAYMREGNEHFQLVANQFLSQEPGNNQELYDLALHWDVQTDGRPTLAFTLSPSEVLQNRELLSSMSHAFRLYPRLSIDSLDDDALGLLDLNFTMATALESLEFLANLRLPLRLNYLMIYPGLTLNSLTMQLARFLDIARATGYLSARQKLWLALDLFAGCLHVTPGTPLAQKPGISIGYEQDLPHSVLAVLSRAQRAIEVEMERLDTGDGHDPLLAVINAGLEEATKWNP